MSTMIRTVIFIATLILASTGISAQLRFNGASFQPITETPAASTGLNHIYVLHDLENVSITYTLPSATSAVEWSTFGYQGAAQATPLPAASLVRNGVEITLSNPTPNTGYCITASGAAPYYFWLVDLSAYPLQFNALTLEQGQSDCQTITLQLNGSAPRIPFYAINARALELDRDIELTYSTLQPVEGKIEFTNKTAEKRFPYINSSLRADAPLCSTSFTLSGDKFMRQWGIEQTVSSTVMQPYAVDAITEAIQQPHDADNEQKTDVALGGSAPVDITFRAAVSDAAIFHEWQISADPEFEYIRIQTQELEFNHIFDEMGTFYVRFHAANADGTCEYFSETYTVNIGESQLLCPNAFSPGSTPGVNDEWKVSYKSITSFECYIFDRWGSKMAEFHNPSQGWDGKYKGKYVPAGVYYYVIKARGADGRVYEKAGDINILKSNR